MAKKLTGLAISRKADKYIFSWKHKEKDYSAQDLKYRLYSPSKKKWGKWHDVSVKKKATSKSVTVELTKKYTKIQFGVRAKKSGKWSDWAYESWDIKAPPAPAIAVTLNSEFSSTFTWAINVSDTNKQPFTSYSWQTVLRKDSNLKTKDGEKAGWTSIGSDDRGTSTKPNKHSDSITREETGWSSSTYSYTRWVRVRSNGPGGNSNWVYAKHVYARSLQTSNVSATLYKQTGSGSTVSVNWTTSGSQSKPVDKTIVQYLITVPGTITEEIDNVKVTTLVCPSGGSWTSLNALGGKTGKRGLSFPITNDIPKNNVVFVRVNTVHDADSSTVEGLPVLVKGGLAGLSKPTGLHITESDPSTRKYTVEATNSSGISGAFMAVLFRTTSNQDANQVIGIIPAGAKSVTVQLPEFQDGDAVSIGVQSYVADYTPSSQPYTQVVTPTGNPVSNEYYELIDGSYVLTEDTTVNPSKTYYICTKGTATIYSLTNKRMWSDVEWDGGAVPLPPARVNATQASSNSIQVSWEWTWDGATSAELSWADHNDAWESTNAPSTFTVTNVHASKWIISDLAVGMWYVRVRLIKTIGDTTTYGTYSDIKEVKLSASPDTPNLTIPEPTVTEEGTVKCYWAYVSNDGTGQLQADIAEAFIDEGTITYSEPIQSTNAAQFMSLSVKEDLHWTAGSTHYLVVRVTSISGESSVGWSAPVAINVVDRVTAEITQTSLELLDIPVESEDGEGTEMRSGVLSLRDLPLTATTIGAGDGGMTRYIIERNGNYDMDRPDESEYEGYDGETIVIKTMPQLHTETAESPVSITQDDLIGYLDDGASYRLIAEIQDSHGQVAKAEPIEFEVHWDHQAIVPDAEVSIDRERNIAYIRPLMPEEGYGDGDVCDIYRLSVDKPELIYAGAQFETMYVDPYPTLGEFGGYRVVYRTKYNDYITDQNEIAWREYTADNPQYRLDLFGIVIDFEGNQLILPYDVTLSNSWNKDFIETRYLGGSIQGDWNPGVSKSSSLSTRIAIEYDPDNIELVRRLAVYPGICHIRTPDGSSFSANVNVKEDREEKMIRRLAKITLDITRVDSSGFDGMTYREWTKEDE